MFLGARGSRLREEGLGLEGWADTPQVCPGSPKRPEGQSGHGCASRPSARPTAAASSSCLAQPSCSPHPFAPRAFCSKSKHFIPIICEYPMQMTQHNMEKTFLPLDPTRQSGS